jgi:uncharacterized protein
MDSKIEFQFRVNGIDPEEASINRANGVIPAFETRDIVLGGEIIARKMPPVKQEEYKASTGEELKEIKPEKVKVIAGNNVDVMDNGRLFVVSEKVTAGYTDYSDGIISVTNSLEVSGDRLSASILIYPASSMKRVISIGLIREIIERAGIKYGINLDEIEEFFTSEWKKAFPPKRIVIAKGKPPVQGEDAKISMMFTREKRKGYVKNSTDPMDSRWQSLIHNVKKDELLAEKIPFSTGVHGKDVFGDIIPASPGKDCKLIQGMNVYISPEGLSLFSAMDGMMVIHDNNSISVTETHEIQGDIDMSTGNIIMEGSLIIKGWVRSGFVVRASGEIHVINGVEQATIEAGAGLFIQGGIVGGGKANIASGGDLMALFIENSRAHAKGDIIVCDDIMNSNISAGSSIDATDGKGHILGGTLTALKGIKANETGSPAGVKTNIFVGIDPEQVEREEKIKRHLESFRHQKAKIDMVLVRFRNQKGQVDIPRSMRFKIDKLIKQRRNIAQMEAKLNSYMEGVHQKESDAEDNLPTLSVNRMIFAGTKINIKGSVMDVKTDMPGNTKLYLDENSRITYIKNESQ